MDPFTLAAIIGTGVATGVATLFSARAKNKADQAAKQSVAVRREVIGDGNGHAGIRSLLDEQTSTSRFQTDGIRALIQVQTENARIQTESLLSTAQMNAAQIRDLRQDVVDGDRAINARLDEHTKRIARIEGAATRGNYNER